METCEKRYPENPSKTTVMSNIHLSGVHTPETQTFLFFFLFTYARAETLRMHKPIPAAKFASPSNIPNCLETSLSRERGIFLFRFFKNIITKDAWKRQETGSSSFLLSRFEGYTKLLRGDSVMMNLEGVAILLLIVIFFFFLSFGFLSLPLDSL